MKKGKKKQHSAPGHSSGGNLFRTMIVLGVFLSAATLLASLFIYFRSSIFESLAGLHGHIRTVIVLGKVSDPPDIALDIILGAFLHTESYLAAQSGNGASYTSDGPYGPEDPHEIGNMSDLDMEAVPTQEGVVYTAVLDTSMGPMVYYSQGDARWADYLYGGTDPMKKYGCGPTATAMLISSFSYEGANATPKDLADWAAANGCHAPQSGSYHSLISRSLSAYGLKVESVQDRSPENVRALLQSEHVLVALMGRGALTQNGHFILITRALDNGYVSIADPNLYENCKKDWDLDALLSELKRNYDSGGPLWAVSWGNEE